MQTFDEYSAKYPDLADQLYKMQHRQLPDVGKPHYQRFLRMSKG
jgi:transketolase